LSKFSFLHIFIRNSEMVFTTNTKLCHIVFNPSSFPHKVIITVSKVTRKANWQAKAETQLGGPLLRF
jgi:hypothetical protein